MYARQTQHDEAKLLPHLEPVVQPLGEPAVLGAAPQLDVGSDQTCNAPRRDVGYDTVHSSHST